MATAIRPDRVDQPGERIFEWTEYPEETSPIVPADAPVSSSLVWPSMDVSETIQSYGAEFFFY